MSKWKIGAERDADKLCACLENAREQLREQGIITVGEQAVRGSYTFYTYRLVRPAEAAETAIEAFADAVARYVTDVWERRELERIVSEDFYYYEKSEVEYLAESGVAILAGLRDENGSSLRFQHIARQVADQLKNSGELVVEGLLRFRMQGLHDDLHRVIEQAIDEYLLEVEQQEFVKLLRYFLEAQDAKMPLLHLVHLDDSMTLLYDAQGQPLASDAVPGLPESAREAGLQVEELMSVLIALAPEQLHIHLQSEETPPWLDTVNKIFAERAHVCRGCPICRSAREEVRDYPNLNERSKKV